MSAQSLESRVASLEAEVARLKAKLGDNKSEEGPWWRQIAGTFEGDPYYAEAARLGREYRDSTRPKKRRKKK